MDNQNSRLCKEKDIDAMSLSVNQYLLGRRYQTAIPPGNF